MELVVQNMTILAGKFFFKCRAMAKLQGDETRMTLPIDVVPA